MKKTMMYLPDDLSRFLAQEASARGVSMAEVAREAISEYRAARKPTGVGAIIGVIEDDDGPADMSERVDELLDSYYAPGGKWDQEHGFAPPEGGAPAQDDALPDSHAPAEGHTPAEGNKDPRA